MNGKIDPQGGIPSGGKDNLGKPPQQPTDPTQTAVHSDAAERGGQDPATDNAASNRDGGPDGSDAGNTGDGTTPPGRNEHGGGHGEGPRRRRLDLKMLAIGLGLFAVAFALLFVPSFAADAFQQNQSLYGYLRLFIIVMMTLGTGLAASAVFDLDSIKAQFEIPGVKKGTANVVGGFMALLLIAGGFHMSLSDLKPPKQTKTPEQVLKGLLDGYGIVTADGLKTVMDSDRTAFLQDPAFRKNVADAVAEKFQTLAVSDRRALIADFFTHETRPLTITAELIMKDISLDHLRNDGRAISTGRWATSETPGQEDYLDGLKVALNTEKEQLLYFLEEGKTQPLLGSALEIDPENFELSLHLFLPEERMKERFCGPIRNVAVGVVGADGHGKEF